ncbi:hypothetical protein PUNSTDRAFT_141199, partial [Punctularia strigosozonata HHB-11173 SS5]|uniref:uncharacterized protein n=1 Tax=Punctularia strigosozonata (strain HHB-11173) TaxID=741275 RepID=UPI000441819A
MPDVSLPVVGLASIVVESSLYGLFLATFLACEYVLLHKRTGRSRGINLRSNAKLPVLASSIVLFFLITMHWAIDIFRLFRAFIGSGATVNGPLLFYANLGDRTYVAKTAVFAITGVIADGLIIYRLYIIWNRNLWICIAPILSLLPMFGCSVGVLYHLSTFKLAPGGNIFIAASGFKVAFYSVWSTTLVTNVLCTVLISLRIWSTTRKVRSMGSSNLTPMLSILIESAALYTFSIVAILASYGAKSNGHFVATDTTPAIIGISYCLIIIRVGLGRSYEHKNDTTLMVSSYRGHSSNSRATGLRGTDHANIMPMAPIAINIPSEVDIDHREGSTSEIRK